MQFRAISGILLALALAATPADARRRAVDEDRTATPDPDTGFVPQTTADLGGYCDLDNAECGPNDGLKLSYTVKLGTESSIDRVFVQGNGILSFGRAVNFDGVPDGSDFTLRDIILGGFDPDAPRSPRTPDLLEYGLNLVSVGQDNFLDEDEEAFLQSARLSLGAGGRIIAQWFTCTQPTNTGSCPDEFVQSLTLTPTGKGFAGVFTSFRTPQDAGFVIDGVYEQQRAGQQFLIPAEFTGLDLSSAAPEPASWAMLIAGFGLAGASLRRHRAATA
jgi:hypothetical protein